MNVKSVPVQYPYQLQVLCLFTILKVLYIHRRFERGVLGQLHCNDKQDHWKSVSFSGLRLSCAEVWKVKPIRFELSQDILILYWVGIWLDINRNKWGSQFHCCIISDTRVSTVAVLEMTVGGYQWRLRTTTLEDSTDVLNDLF